MKHTARLRYSSTPMIAITLALSCLSLAACGGGGGAASSGSLGGVSPAPSPTPTPTPTPVPSPTPTPTPVASLPPDPIPDVIASNFAVSSGIIDDNHGSIPDFEVPDKSEGAFRFICNASHEAYDDPIVYPGQPGKSHLHEFYGNTLTDANSTYQSLRTTGESTCMNKVNRSGYWQPAMLNGDGKVVRPDWVSIYYKRGSAVFNPRCHLGNPQAAGECVELPRGLRFIFGYNMLNPSDTPTGALWFNCDGPTAVPGHYSTLVEAAKNCPVGNQIGAIIVAPDCWDGKHLDSADHRSHVSFGSYGSWGYYKCPDTHPNVIPQFTLAAWYTVDDGLDHSGTWAPGMKTWHLSSDTMPGMPEQMPGTTFHADWFGAWDDTVMKTWTDHCIDQAENCSGGQLGDGTRMADMPGFSLVANPHLVDPPAH